METVDRAGNPTARSFLYGNTAMVRYVDGDLVGAVESFNAAIDEARITGSLSLVNGWHTGVAFVW